MYQVRDGKQVAPTCHECGCRLGQFEDVWYHFRGTETKDARGCICLLYTTGIEINLPQKIRFDNSI